MKTTEFLGYAESLAVEQSRYRVGGMPSSLHYKHYFSGVKHHNIKSKSKDIFKLVSVLNIN
jgi:hypothetical protein